MLCKKCGYKLWSTSKPACPECGTAFCVTAYAFPEGAAGFTCGACRHAHPGRGHLGHPVLTDGMLICQACGEGTREEELTAVLLGSEADEKKIYRIRWKKAASVVPARVPRGYCGMLYGMVFSPHAAGCTVGGNASVVKACLFGLWGFLAAWPMMIFLTTPVAFLGTLVLGWDLQAREDVIVLGLTIWGVASLTLNAALFCLFVVVVSLPSYLVGRAIKKDTGGFHAFWVSTLYAYWALATVSTVVLAAPIGGFIALNVSHMDIHPGFVFVGFPILLMTMCALSAWSARRMRAGMNACPEGLGGDAVSGLGCAWRYIKRLWSVLRSPTRFGMSLRNDPSLHTAYLFAVKGMAVSLIPLMAVVLPAAFGLILAVGGSNRAGYSHEMDVAKLLAGLILALVTVGWLATGAMIGFAFFAFHTLLVALPLYQLGVILGMTRKGWERFVVAHVYAYGIVAGASPVWLVPLAVWSWMTWRGRLDEMDLLWLACISAGIVVAACGVIAVLAEKINTGMSEVAIGVEGKG